MAEVNSVHSDEPIFEDVLESPKPSTSSFELKSSYGHKKQKEGEHGSLIKKRKRAITRLNDDSIDSCLVEVTKTLKAVNDNYTSSNTSKQNKTNNLSDVDVTAAYGIQLAQRIEKLKGKYKIEARFHIEKILYEYELKSFDD